MATATWVELFACSAFLIFFVALIPASLVVLGKLRGKKSKSYLLIAIFMLVLSIIFWVTQGVSITRKEISEKGIGDGVYIIFASLGFNITMIVYLFFPFLPEKYRVVLEREGWGDGGGMPNILAGTAGQGRPTPTETSVFGPWDKYLYYAIFILLVLGFSSIVFSLLNPVVWVIALISLSLFHLWVKKEKLFTKKGDMDKK